jgi:hypothetical protein
MGKKNTLTVVVFSIFFFACEEEVIPIQLSPPPPLAQGENDSVLSKQNEAMGGVPSVPETVTAPSKAKSTPVPAAKQKAKPAPVAQSIEDSDQLSSGRYTIQIAIFPSEVSARALVKKMSGSGIKAYYARVDSPAKLLGLYYRVRVGFFNGRADAEIFAKTRLEPLGYAWWIDRRMNDNLGSVSSILHKESAPAAHKPARAVSNNDLEAAKQAYKELAKEAVKSVSESSTSQEAAQKRVKIDKSGNVKISDK